MNGRHSAVKKSTRNTSGKAEINKVRKNREEHIKSGNSKENEIVLNIPVISDDRDKNDKKIHDVSSNKEEKERKKNKKKKMNKILKVILIILITILLVFVTIFARYVIKNGGDVRAAVKEMFKDAVGDQDPIFILVMGISEDISAELTDTIMLIGYNPDTNQAFVLSIPRDSYVGKNINNGTGGEKINALYQINKHNPEKSIEAVENITGINIDYYVIVKTSVLVNIVDTLGGVDFDVPVNMDYDDDTQDLHIHLKAGQQRLNGDQAEQLVRFRHNNNNTSYPASYGDNDEGRTRTQREFLKTVVEKVIQTRDIDKIKTIAKSVFDNLETNIKWDQAVGYLPYAIDFKMEELEMSQLPGGMVKTTLWFFKVDSTKTEEVINGYIQKLGLTEAEKKQFLKSKTSKPTQVIDAAKKKNESSGEKKDTSTNTTTKNTKTDSEKTTTKNTTKSSTTEKTTKKEESSSSKTNKNNDNDEEDNSSSSNNNSSSTNKNEGASSSESGENNGSGSKPDSSSSESGGQSSGGGSSESGGGSSSSGNESGSGETSSSSSSNESGN